MVRERPEAMTRGLVLGCLLLFLAGWLAPVPAQAMSRPAALWRTAAFAHTAVAHAQAMLGAEDAALATLAVASALAPEIRPEG